MFRSATVDYHHQVVPYWAELRRELGEPLAVLSLDYHTDIMPCSGNGKNAPAPDAWKEPETVAKAVALLRHDEHFDWALRAGICSQVRIIHLAPQSMPPAHNKIELRRNPLVPAPEVILNEPETYRPTAELQLDDRFLAPLLDHWPPDTRPFVLDIDCDYILCERALHPERDELFRSLCRRAAAVTLSCESDWVKLLKLPGETITGESIAKEIYSFFHFALDFQ